MTNELTPCSRILLEKITIAQMVKKLLYFYVTQTFTAVFTIPPLDPSLSQFNSAYILTPCSLKIQFNVISVGIVTGLRAGR